MKSPSLESAIPLTLPETLSRAWRAWRQHPRLLAAAIALLFLQQLFHTYFAYSLKLILDNALRGLNDPPLSLILLGLLAAFGVMAGAALAGENVNAAATALLANDLRRRLYEQLQRLSADFYAKIRLGDILARFSGDLRAVEAGYTQAFLNSILTTLGLLINVPFLLYLEWRLALAALVALPVLMLVVRRLLARSLAAGVRLRQSEADVVNMVQETVRAQAIIKTFVLEDWFAQRFEAELTELKDTTVRSRFTMALISKISSLGVLLVQLLVACLGATLVFQQELSVGAYVSFMTVLGVVAKDAYEFAKKVVPVLIEAAAGLGRLEALLTARVAIQDAPDACALERVADGLRFEAVTFSYGGQRRDLDQVSLTIPAGQSVVFVGASGSGKSTVLSLIMRFYDPQAGVITLDGVDLRRATQRSLRGQLGVVFQENYLFNASLRDNIRLGRPEASDAEIEQAARAAEIHDLIVQMPQGYATLAGEAGGRLSGGQRQRIALARALLADPAILLLDEATSALDPATEAAINATLERLKQGRTVIAITHRLLAAQQADRIFVLQTGRLVEQGTHAELLAAGGVYHGLWHKQGGFDVSDDGRYARVDAGRLQRIALFARLSPEALHKAAGVFRPEYFESGQTVIRQGDPGDKFYLIVRGQVQVRARDTRGRDHFVEVLEDGDHFGEMALLTDQPRNATLTALTPCLFLTMSRGNLNTLVGDFPEMAETLRERMALSVRNLQALESAAQPAAGS